MLSHVSERDHRVVITGASTGVGRATALALARRGAKVVLACRSRERAERVAAELRAAGARHPARVIELDLAELESVRRAARELASEGPIDVLINNAGVGGLRGATIDGFELAFGTNALGHFLFTRLLVPVMRERGRIVHLGSGSYARARSSSLDGSRLIGRTRSLTGIPEYAASKLAVMLLHLELTRQLTSVQSTVISVVADPGDVASDAYRHVPWPIRVLLTRGMKSCEEGARTPVYCASSPLLEGVSGGCYVDCAPFDPEACALDVEAAASLWQQCSAWTGLAPRWV